MSDDSVTRPFDRAIAEWAEVVDRVPFGAFADGVDLVVVRTGDDHSVLSGRCQHLIGVMARACGHSHASELNLDDLVTFDRDLHHLSGVAYAGVHA